MYHLYRRGKLLFVAYNCVYSKAYKGSGLIKIKLLRLDSSYSDKDSHFK